MHYIDINLPKIEEAKNLHYRMLRFIVKKKLLGTDFIETAPIPNMNRIYKINWLDGTVVEFLNDEENLKNVLIGKPEVLDRIKDQFDNAEDVVIKSIKIILNYKEWMLANNAYRQYHSYHLAEKLDIPTCVYCNRTYTKTVIKQNGKKVTRPTFDHWFPKSKYPLLSLSFFNLIPSCTVCNSGVKGAAPFSLSTHFHPYYENSDIELNYKFSYDHLDYNRFIFNIKSNNEFSENSVTAFELEEIYKTHEDEIEDLRKIRDAYSENYLTNLETQILGNKITLDREEIYRLAFGVHYEEAKFDRRPLSKMKKDLLIELGILK